MLTQRRARYISRYASLIGIERVHLVTARPPLRGAARRYVQTRPPQQYVRNHMKSVHQTQELRHSWISLSLLLAALTFSAARTSAQVDTTANDAQASAQHGSRSPKAHHFCCLRAFNKAFKSTRKQWLPSLAWPPSISLGSSWELAPALAFWHLKVYSKEQWNLRLAFPVRWFPWSDQANRPMPLPVWASSLPEERSPLLTREPESFGGCLHQSVSPRRCRHIWAKPYECRRSIQLSISLGLRVTPSK